MRNVLITTLHRGVWFAQVEENKDLTSKTLTDLKNCKMAIYWATKKGLQELCEVGPNSNSRISSASELNVLHDVTAVFAVSDKAAQVWMQA